MPRITIDGKTLEFTPGEKVLDVANRAREEGIDLDVPQYCYHPGLSVPAQCRICLAEMWAPNARNGNALEPIAGGKLLPTCSTEASDGMVVSTLSPKAVANQKAVMEYLLINHPLDCPVCDQAGECTLQDYSYRHGRATSRFEETKLKQPKKDLGPNILIYSDRCIMCTRCVRFAREVPETSELVIDGRGNQSQIDVFPGMPLDNDLASNVIDLCPVGALLDKDFLFAQRVWFLRKTPSIDGITSSGDNISIEHNEGRIYRVKPRVNMEVNRWWITDEVRYGWKFVHSEDRLRSPIRKQHSVAVECDYTKAYQQVLSSVEAVRRNQGRLLMVVSPMLPCEEAFLLAELALRLDPRAEVILGPVAFEGEDRHYPPSLDPEGEEFARRGFTRRAEKAPNARGVRRVLEAVLGRTPQEANWIDDIRAYVGGFGTVFLTGNYPSAWATPELVEVLRTKLTVLVDTLRSDLVDVADVVIPGATWAEKSGTFENAGGLLQAFDAAIPVIQMAKPEGQIAIDLMAMLDGEELDRFLPPGNVSSGVMVVDEQPGQVPEATAVVAVPRASRLYNAGEVRSRMASSHEGLRGFATDVRYPRAASAAEPDMRMVEL